MNRTESSTYWKDLAWDSYDNAKRLRLALVATWLWFVGFLVLLVVFSDVIVWEDGSFLIGIRGCIPREVCNAGLR